MSGATAHDEIDGLLVEYLLGTLEPAEQRRAEALAQTPEGAGRLAALERTMSQVTAAQRAPVAVGRRLVDALAGAARFEHLVPRLAKHFDVSEAAARALVASFDGAAAWQPGPAPGLELLPVAAGPKWAGFLCVVVRLQPGAQLPMHRHASQERVLVLEGGYRDDQSGEEFWRGRDDVREAGTAHSFTALAGLPCLCASVVMLAEGP